MAIESLRDVQRAGTSAFSTGGGSASIVQATVDFGAIPVDAKAFDVTVAGATVGQKVVATICLDMPAGVDEDELEMDMLSCAGRVLSTNTVRLIVASATGPVTGQRNVNLILG